MKITNNDNPIPTTKVSTEKTATTASGAKADLPKEVTSSHQATNSVKQQMHLWFAKAGISPGMIFHDEKSRKRAVDRRRDIQAVRVMQNLSSILENALTVSVGEPSAEKMDPDWFFNFIRMAENIHSTQMQELWGKIFAVETSQPGSFSLRSLETLTNLTQRDAKLFLQAAKLASRRQGDGIPRLLIGYHQKRGLFSKLFKQRPGQVNLGNFGLSYPDLLALIDMKLIYASEIETGELDPDKRVVWRSASGIFNLTPRGSGMALKYYKFTSVGAELYKLISRQENPEYQAALRQVLTPGFIVE